MRIATVAEAVQSLSRTRQSAILLVTADPMCGSTAFLHLGFLPQDAVATLMLTGTVVLGATSPDEFVAMRDMADRFEEAFDAQPRLGAEALLFHTGTLVYRLTCDGVQPSQLAA